MKQLPHLKIIFLSALTALITTLLLQSSNTATTKNLQPQEIFQQSSPATLNIKLPDSGATGFIFDSQGLVLTNKHVVEDQLTPITAFTNTGKELQLINKTLDPLNDIAILQIQGGGNFPYLQIAPSPAQVAQKAYSISNELGQYPSTFSHGLITGTNRKVSATQNQKHKNLNQLIQNNLPLNIGSSGGPLLNDQAQVIGMNVAVAENINNTSFAIPAQELKNVINIYYQHKEIKRPSLGARFKMLTPQEAKLIDPSLNHGALITTGKYLSEKAILPNSTAQKIGLQQNDIILSINNQAVTTDSPLDSIIQNLQINQQISLEIWRNKQKISKKGKLEAL